MSARLGFPNMAGPAPDAAAPLPIASQIEAHSVLQVLSEGPNGFVYLTRDATHGATRVLKEFMPRSRLLRLSDGSVRPCDVSDSIATSVARIAFMNEANTLAAFQHPALIRVLGVIPAHRTLYRVMPLVDGVSLEQHCRTRADPPSLAWLQGLVDGLLQALEVLHERRVGHGSVRPAQVMVRESGQPLLLGFASVARELDAVAPAPWQSPGAAHLTRHAPPVPADDLPALAETAYFAATGLQAPTLQQRLEGAPFDLRSALGALADAPGESQQRRRGLLLALEAAFATSAHARPQSVAEFRRLLTGDVPTRGGRHQPTPRWVGEMPERDDIEVALLISQPAPLSDDLPPVPRPVAAVPVLAPVVIPPAVPAAPPVLATPPLAAPEAVPPSPSPSPVADPAARIEPASRQMPEAAWPFEPEAVVEPEEPVQVVVQNPEVRAAADTVAAAKPEPVADAEPAEPLWAVSLPPDVLPEREFEPRSRSRVERDFAATEFLVASADATDVPTPFYASAPDTEPFIANLRPDPARRTRSPYAAMAAVAVLALVGVGIASWWNADSGQAGPAGTPLAQTPVAGATPHDSPAATPAAAAPLAPAAVPPSDRPAVAAAPEATPAPAQPADAVAHASPRATSSEAPGAPGSSGSTTPTSSVPLAPRPGPVVPEANAMAAPAIELTPVTAAPVQAAARPPTPTPTEVATAAPAVAPSAAPAAPPSATVMPATAPRATRSAGATAPPQSARPNAPQRTAAAAASRANKPAAPRPSSANGRATAETAAGPRTLGARSPLAACGSRTQFSLVYCMQQQCARPAYQAHPQCANLRNGG